MKLLGGKRLIFRRIKQVKILCILLTGIAFFCSINIPLYAEDMTEARINIGLKLFRATLAADLQIKSKKNKNGELPLILIYKKNSVTGKKLARKLMQTGKKNIPIKIKNIPVKVTPISYQTFMTGQYDQPAGIFFVDKISKQNLIPITSYSIKNKIITYSPFHGDLEKNIVASLEIGARIRPLINLKILKESDIQMNPFFLKVVQKYALK